MPSRLRYFWWETAVGLIALSILADLLLEAAPGAALTSALLALVAIVLIIGLIFYSLNNR